MDVLVFMYIYFSKLLDVLGILIHPTNINFEIIEKYDIMIVLKVSSPIHMEGHFILQNTCLIIMNFSED